MNIRKKVSGIAFSATLLASIVAVVAAPSAFASVSVTSAGAIPRGTTSATPATFTLTENFASCFINASDTDALDITILDSAGNPTVHFVGPVTVASPGSLGPATATITPTDNNIRVAFGGADTANIEQIAVSAKIKADTGAANGAIKATLTGNQAGCVIPGGTGPASVGTTTATGHLQAPNSAGTSASNLVVDPASCPFEITGGILGNTEYGAVLKINTGQPNAESVAITADNGDVIVAGVQPITTALTVNSHAASEPVTQVVENCNPTVIGSPGTVSNALFVSADDTPIPQVLPGENNQAVNDTTLNEETQSGTNSPAAVFAAGMTVTFTIQTAGVVFSASPSANPNSDINLGAGDDNAVPCSLSVDRKSCTVTVTANDGAGPTYGGDIELENTLVDVATTAVIGTPVTITASTSPSVPVIVDPGVANIVAFIGRVVIGVAAQPPIFIGFNDQASGTKTLTESGPGFFQAGVGTNNTFALCIATGETFTRAPWAIVTVGDLKLLSGVVGASQVKMTLYNGGNCAYATVYTASTVASKIEIRGSMPDGTILPAGATNGPNLSVPNSLAPGSEQAAIFIGDSAAILGGCTTVGNCATDPGFVGFLSEAIRAFKNSVSVTAVSQPVCPPGTTDCVLGNIVIMETQNGQFKPGDVIRGYFVPDSKSLRNEVFIKSGNTNDLPIITTNTTSGLLVSPVIVICPPNVPLLNICFFAFTVNQQSFGPDLGKVTISNIHASIAKDATPGPIQMDWANTALILGIPVGVPAGQPFESVVTNGTTTVPPKQIAISITSAVGEGIDQGATSVGTDTAIGHASASGAARYATWRFTVPTSLAGEYLNVYCKTRTDAGTYGAYALVKRVKVDTTGNAYFHVKHSAGTWESCYATSTATATHLGATSRARSAHFIS